MSTTQSNNGAMPVDIRLAFPRLSKAGLSERGLQQPGSGFRRPVRLRLREVATSRLWVLSLVSIVLMSFTVWVTPAAQADTGTPPGLLGVLGGPSHAQMYPSGLEVAANGDLVVADTGNNQVVRFSASGQELWRVGGYGTGVGKFNNPRDVALDSAGNAFVADTASNRMVKLSASGAWLSTFNGTPAEKMGTPMGVSVTNDVVYVADAGSKKVRVFDTNGTQIRNFGASGTCVLSALRDVDADASGNVYIANYEKNNILKMSATGSCITQWGTKGSADGQFMNPYGVRIAFDPVLNTRMAYVADSNNGRIQVFSLAGVHYATMGQEGSYDQPGQFKELRRVAVASDGDVWGADLWGWKLMRFDRSAAGYDYVQTIGGVAPPKTANAIFHEPRGIGFGEHGDFVVADAVHHQVVRMSPTGKLLGTCGDRGWSPGRFNWPRGAAVDQVSGEIWVADTKQSRLQVITPTCDSVAVMGSAGTGLANMNWPQSIAMRISDRTAWIVDTKNSRMLAYNVQTRAPIAAFGSLGSGNGQFKDPRGIAISPVDNHIWVADRGNNRIVELSASQNATQINFVRSIGGFNRPAGVALDSQGRIYVADTLNNRVVVLAANGTVTATLTGPGPNGFFQPEALAVDSHDKLYVADTYNDRIVTYSYQSQPADPFLAPTFVGNFVGEGRADMYPVDVASTPSLYYVLDSGGYRVRVVDRATGNIVGDIGGQQGKDPGQFAAARAIDVDSSGNIYVADTANNRVQKFNPSLELVAVWGVIGTGPGQFSDVYGIAVGQGRDSAGQPAEVVYASDVLDGTGRVQKFDLAGNLIGVFAQGVFNQPRQMETNPISHDLYVVSAREGKVRVFDEFGAQKSPIGNGSGTGPGRFKNDPRGVALSNDGATVYVSDQGNYRIQYFSTATTSLLGQFGFADLARTSPDGFYEIRGIDFTNDNKLIVTDEWDYSLKEFQANGAFVRDLFGAGPPVGGVNAVRGIAVDSAGRVYASDWWNQRIERWNSDGSGVLAWGQRGTRTDNTLNFAWDVTVQPGTNRVFVANRESHEIEVFSSTGAFVTRWGDRGSAPGQVEFPHGVAFAPDGTLMVADSGNNRIERFSINANGVGTFVESYGLFGGSKSAAGLLNGPTGVAVAVDGSVWVADTLNNRIQKRLTNGTWLVFRRPTNSTLDDNFSVPWGVSVATDGSIWVADSGNNRIVKLDDKGAMYFEADGPALGAGSLDAPFEVTFGPSGAIYVSDTWNDRIVQLG